MKYYFLYIPDCDIRKLVIRSIFKQITKQSSRLYFYINNHITQYWGQKWG